MTEPQHVTDGEMPASLTDLIKAIELDPSYWRNTAPDIRARFTEKVFWEYIGNQTSKRKEVILAEPPSRRWWIECPQVLEIHEENYLCEICRHIDFEYLIDSPMEQIREEIPFASLNWLLEHDNCAFCRLVSSTMRSTLGKSLLPAQFDGKDITCTMRTLPMETDMQGPREIAINMSEEIVSSNNLKFYRFSAADASVTTTPKCELPSSLLSEINFELVKSWYSECLNGKCGPKVLPKDRNLPKGFILIDVVQRYCIVDATAEDQYVALSYVWGNVGGLRNLRRHNKSLEREGAILERIDEIPRTIRDAMSLTNSIGIPYLWVDSLCIIQDDPDDMGCQVTAMDRIYSSATLTVAVTSGDNADAGLSGMGTRPRSFRQNFAKIQGMYLANRPLSFFCAVDHSVWNSRAWTLQERVMSPRTLFVAEQKCFFSCQCRSDVLIESSDPLESGTAGPRDRTSSDTGRIGNILASQRAVNVRTYRQIVETYTSRQLSYPSDILNAFKGIEAALHPLFRSDFIFGLPRSEIDSQLLWQPTGLLTRRRSLDTGLPIFPSWTWAGWVGEVQCETFEHLSRIEWVEANGERYSAKDFRYPTGANQDPMRRIDYRLEWRGALGSNGTPYYCEKKNPDQWFFHPTAPEEERTIGPHLKRSTDHLLFEAETTDSHNIGMDHYWPMSGMASKRCTEQSHTVCPLPLLDPDGYLAGYIKVPGEVFIRFRDDMAKGTFVPNGYEFVMISRGKIFQQKDRGEGNPDLLVDSEAITMEKTYFPDRPTDTFSDSCGFDRQRFDATKPWCIFNVMLVEFLDGVAYRLGVGIMHIDSWARATPKKKIVELG